MRLLMLFALLLWCRPAPSARILSVRATMRMAAFHSMRQDLNAPDVGDSGACPGGFARGSQIQDSRDGTQDLFCD